MFLVDSMMSMNKNNLNSSIPSPMNGYCQSRVGLLKRLNHWRIRKGRELRNRRLLAWYQLRYEKSRPRLPIEDLPHCKSVCLLLIDSGIGDVIVLSGFISALRKAGKQVSCICNEKSYRSLSALVKTDGLFKVPKKPRRRDVASLGIICDVIVVFGDPDKNLHRDILVITSVKHRYAVGFNQKDNRFFDLNVKRSEEGCHWTARLIDCAAHLGVRIEDYRYDLHFSPQCLAAVDDFAAKLNRPFALFNPTASDKFRSLSPECIAETISWLLAHTSLAVVVTNVTDESIISKFPQVIFNHFKELDCNMALVGKCSFLITVDTSFVHAGNYFDKPMIGIYNNRRACNRYDNNVQWGPNYAKAVQVFSLDHVNTETGDDLRRFPFAVLEPALQQAKDLK